MRDNKTQYYSVCEFIASENRMALEFTPTPICITSSRDKLMCFLDNYLLNHIKVTDEDDAVMGEKTELSITIDQNWWQNRNNRTWPLHPIDDYPSYIIIKQTLTNRTFSASNYLCLHINRSFIEFL